MTLFFLYKCNLSAGEEMWLIQPLGSSTLTLAERSCLRRDRAYSHRAETMKSTLEKWSWYITKQGFPSGAIGAAKCHLDQPYRNIKRMK